MAQGQADRRPGALSGIRVLDMSIAVSGPMASAILADHGADVVQIERVGRFDALRSVGPQVGDTAAAWVAQNRNKRAIAVDLKSPRGQDVVRTLAAGADVFIQNFRPGVAEGMGLGYEALSATNPGLVYVAISGFGADGPKSAMPAYDGVVQGYTGLVSIQGGELVKMTIADKITALTAAQGATLALFARANGAGGQLVRVNMLDSMLAFLWTDTMWNETLPDEAPTLTYSDFYAPYRTADGFVISSWLTRDQFARILGEFDRLDLLDDPRFDSAAGRAPNAIAMKEAFQQVVASFSSEDALERLRRADVACGPVYSRAQVVSDEQVAHNGILREMAHPVAGNAIIAGPPIDLAATPPGLHRHAPGYGEHTDEVLREIGIPDERIAELHDDHIIA